MNRIAVNKYAFDYAHCVARYINKTWYPDFVLGSTKFDWAPTRRSSRGGIYKDGPGINIAMCHIVPTNLEASSSIIYKHTEYPSFADDPVIGSLYCTDPMRKLDTVIVHEMAHAVQFFSYKKTDTRCKPHGPVFKMYYAALRKHFVNCYLSNQVLLRHQYEKDIDDLLDNNYKHLSNLLSKAASNAK